MTRIIHRQEIIIIIIITMKNKRKRRKKRRKRKKRKIRPTHQSVNKKIDIKNNYALWH